jgi:dihydropteroate synthase
MGILNITPDSFSDGSRYLDVDAAVEMAHRMAQEGADLIDIGGESTRPGAKAVSVQQEIDRVLPVIERLGLELDLPLSIDTSKSAVAQAAMSAGVEFVNDISGLTFDGKMAHTVAAQGAGMILMHTRDHPEHMQRNTDYDDVVGEVAAALRRCLQSAQDAGIPPDKLAIDPGIGFGKNVNGNLELLRRLDVLSALGRPILVGTSRKSFIGQVLSQPDPEQRLYGTLATVALAVAGGARIFRVHDVAPARDAAMVAWAVCQGQAWASA